MTQDAWEERQTDRQKTETDRKIHGIAPEDSPIPPRHMAPWDSDRTEPKLARTQMNGENGLFVPGKGWEAPILASPHCVAHPQLTPSLQDP